MKRERNASGKWRNAHGRARPMQEVSVRSRRFGPEAFNGNVLKQERRWCHCGCSASVLQDVTGVISAQVSSVSPDLLTSCCLPNKQLVWHFELVTLDGIPKRDLCYLTGVRCQVTVDSVCSVLM